MAERIEMCAAAAAWWAKAIEARRADRELFELALFNELVGGLEEGEPIEVYFNCGPCDCLAKAFSAAGLNARTCVPMDKMELYEVQGEMLQPRVGYGHYLPVIIV